MLRTRSFLFPLLVLLLAAVCSTRAGSQDIDTTAIRSLNVVEAAHDIGGFETFLHALEAAGLTPTLEENGPYTLLLPTDEAFEQLPEGTMEQLLKPENISDLISILTHHIIPRELTLDAFFESEDVETVQQTTITAYGDDEAFIGGAPVLHHNIRAGNGIIHAIGQVLLPPTRTADRIK